MGGQDPGSLHHGEMVGLSETLVSYATCKTCHVPEEAVTHKSCLPKTCYRVLCIDGDMLLTVEWLACSAAVACKA